MDSFSMKELRHELEAMGVDYSKCIEKKDMIELLHKVSASLARPAH